MLHARFLFDQKRILLFFSLLHTVIVDDYIEKNHIEDLKNYSQTIPMNSEASAKAKIVIKNSSKDKLAFSNEGNISNLKCISFFKKLQDPKSDNCDTILSSPKTGNIEEQFPLTPLQISILGGSKGF